MTKSGFLDELRRVLVPEKKWHYLFHVLVLFFGLSYWIGSFIKVPDASWPELIMYRPGGDSENWPNITALSKFNFGDPTDAVNYGKGMNSGRCLLFAPTALACTIFGNAGYMVGDAVLAWAYFLGLVLFLRRCNFGNFSSLLFGSSLAMGGLQTLCNKVGESIAKLQGLFGIPMTDWALPNFLSLQIYGMRIPRPMVSEIFLVWALYFLIKTWQDRDVPSFKRGVAVGFFMVLLAQGDPFSLSALGLVLGAIVLWNSKQNRWKLPWNFGVGCVLGGLLTGWYAILQMFHANPDFSGRNGVGKYSRLNLVPLPGLSPLMRVAIICFLAWVVFYLLRRSGAKSSLESRPAPEERKRSKSSELKPSEGASVASESAPAVSAFIKPGVLEKSVAVFCVMLVVAGWLAQPAQLFLAGKGAQIYHFLINTLPVLYSYALVILAFNCLALVLPKEMKEAWANFGRQPGTLGALLLALVLSVQTVMALEVPINSIQWSKNARQEGGMPWLTYGDAYRPAFRALEKEFRTNPTLQQSRSIATFCSEINYLLTGFYDKRAYLPMLTLTELPDQETENRLCEMGKILGLKPEQFANFMRQHYILNHWLGDAKYWFATDYKFSSDDDYPPEAIAYLRQMPKESPFVLVMPNSEVQRMLNKYTAILGKNSDTSIYPDVIVLLGFEKSMGLVPNAAQYQEVYTNDVFLVYKKITSPRT